MWGCGADALKPGAMGVPVGSSTVPAGSALVGQRADSYATIGGSA